MVYRPFGKTGINISMLGLGTNRFSPNDLKDEAGLYRAASIVTEAIRKGINYIDSSYTYSKGMAEKILNIALQQAATPCHVVVKSAINGDKTADDVLRRIESSLKSIGIEKATFFLAWTITSYSEYCEIMKKGGYYEGACKAKDRGLIDHLCFATHCPPEQTIKIIHEGAFEGITLNESVLNHSLNVEILEEAQKANIGVTVMSALGTGVIAKHPEFFHFVKIHENESVSQAALRFVCSSPAVTLALAGVSSKEQLQDNLAAFDDQKEFSLKRLITVENGLDNITDYCIGCGLCNICDKRIPVSKLMQSYNAILYTDDSRSSYGRKGKELLQNIELFKKMKQDYSYIPQLSENPCIHCGKCEEKCPKSIRIMQKVDEIYQRIEKSSFSLEAWKNRLALLANGKYRTVAFYPAGGYTGYVLHYYRLFFGEPNFNIYMFDSNPNMWGKECDGTTIRNPQDISKVHPDCILIANYIYSNEIYGSISHYENEGITILKLHGDDDVPWVF